MSLKIGVLGWDSHLSQVALKQVVLNDKTTTPKKIYKDKVITEDESLYMIVPQEIDKLRGLRFDQLILVDDERWQLLDKHYYLIKDFENYVISTSCVPDEFKIQKYEW